MSKIKVKFDRNKNFVSMTIYEMDERFRNTGIGKNPYFKSKNGLEIRSYNFPDMDIDYVYLKGTNDGRDNCFITLMLDSEEEAIEYIENVKEALIDWAENWEGFKEDKKETIIDNDNIEIFEI